MAYRSKRVCSVFFTLAAAALLPIPGCGDGDAKTDAEAEGGSSSNTGGAADQAGAAGDSAGGAQQQGGAANTGGAAEAGQASAGAPNGSGGTDPGYTPAGDDVQAALNSLASWDQPPEASETTKDLE
ncbi:MAG TPA: hypothetical protein VMF89_24155, partial [Polyangiales bacterium]|nr:hypothetical protein [Polyangiales bacterium]